MELAEAFRARGLKVTPQRQLLFGLLDGNTTEIHEGGGLEQGQRFFVDYHLAKQPCEFLPLLATRVQTDNLIDDHISDVVPGLPIPGPGISQPDHHPSW